MVKKTIRTKAIAKKTKPKVKVQKADPPTHPWRPCPYGKHWVSEHPRDRVSSLGKPFTQFVNGYCRTNPSHHDHLYVDEIQEIADTYFSKLTGPPAIDDFKYKAKGNQYDSLIRGWTQYWNEVLSPLEPLDPDVVKALIATESSFNPLAWNRRHGKNSARGLMQVLNSSVQFLKNPKELKDHFVDLDESDMTNPNLTICAGIRWLFRKKQLAEALTKKAISWRDAVAAYKGVSPTEQKLTPRFDQYLKNLKVKK